MGFYRTLYSNISGSGPHHEEERIWVEQNGDDSYRVYHEIIAPMAGCYTHSFCFDSSISQDDFTKMLYHSLPYAAYVLPKEAAQKLWKDIVMK